MQQVFNIEMGFIYFSNGSGKMMSAYWHPSKQHSASFLHSFGKVVQKVEPEPGYWAVAIARTSLFREKCKYDIW